MINKKLRLLFMSLIMSNSFIFNSFALTPQEQAIINQQKILQQQEQQRQFEQNRQTIEETENIRNSRVKSHVVEDSEKNIKKGRQNKCDLEYDTCANKCEKISNDKIASEESDTPKTKCIQQCTQTKNDCITELEALCLNRFNKIILKGNEVYSVKTLNKEITDEFLNKCINRANIGDIQTKLTKFYIDNGYTMARVYFDMEHLIYEKSTNKQTGEEELKTTFIIIIEEGRVSNIRLDVKKKQTNKEKQMSELYDKYKNLKAKEPNTGSQKELIKLESELEKLALEVREENLKTEKPLSIWKRSRRAMQTFFALPFRIDRVYKMKDYEQGLDQMNRLQSNSVTMDVRPSTGATANSNINTKSQGYSEIILINNQDPENGGVSTGDRTTFFTAGYNNSGSKSTGESVINLSLSQDNLISISDNIYISYTETTNSLFLSSDNKVPDKNNPASKNPFRNKLNYLDNDDEKLKYSKSLYSSISFPLGYWTLTGGLNYSTYKTTNSGLLTTFNTTGQTTTQTYSLDRVAIRTQKYKLNIGTSLELRDTESYIRDIKSQTGSKKTTSATIYFNNTIYTKLGTIIVKPSYQKGLKWFGAKTDFEVYGGQNIFKEEPKLQYTLLKLYAYYNTRINAPLFTKSEVQNPDGTIAKDNDGKEIRTRNKLPISYTLTFDSQYSFDTLYGADRFSVGGEHTIRGYTESTISGENGFYIRNDLRINALHLLPKLITNHKAMNHNSILLTKESMSSILSKTYVSLFYDYGYVKNKYSNSSDELYNSASGALSGFGIGLNYYGDYLNWSLIYSKSLHSPQYLQTRDELEKENHSIYWKIGASW